MNKTEIKLDDVEFEKLLVALGSVGRTCNLGISDQGIENVSIYDINDIVFVRK